MRKTILTMALTLTSAAFSPSSMAQTPPSAPSATISDARPIEDLLTAAQRLRDATHEMVTAAPTAKRGEMIERTDKTLDDVRRAMVNLPTNLLIANANEDSYKRAADRLDEATQRLQDAIKALASDPTSDRGKATVEIIKQALVETHRLMLDLPRK